MATHNVQSTVFKIDTFLLVGPDFHSVFDGVCKMAEREDVLW